MKTFSTRPSDVRREWHVIDADGQPLGRLSTQVATYLRGKHKPIFAPHLDVGDFVIVLNAAKVRLTGKKLEQKRYYHHSGYPGGLKVREVKHELERRPERVVERAVRGMLPKGPLGLQLFRHLKVYSGATHPHAAQVNAPPPPPFTPGLPASNARFAPRAASAESAATTAESEPQLPATPVEAEPPAEAESSARRRSRAARSTPPVEAALPAPAEELELPAPEKALELPAAEPNAEEPQV